jgi:hypothetical protein
MTSTHILDTIGIPGEQYIPYERNLQKQDKNTTNQFFLNASRS